MVVIGQLGGATGVTLSGAGREEKERQQVNGHGAGSHGCRRSPFVDRVADKVRTLAAVKSALVRLLEWQDDEALLRARTATREGLRDLAVEVIAAVTHEAKRLLIYQARQDAHALGRGQVKQPRGLRGCQSGSWHLCELTHDATFQ